jgi:hypothetical protein
MIFVFLEDLYLKRGKIDDQTIVVFGRSCTNTPMVWIVRSSIIKWAFEHAGSRPVGTNIGLQRYGYSVLWVGHPGLKVAQVLNLVHARIGTNGLLNRCDLFLKIARKTEAMRKLGI